MHDPIKNGYINWIDGMKISKDHFVDMQKAVEDRLRDVRSIQVDEYGFGLLAGKVNGRYSLEYNLVIEHPAKVKVEVYHCRAISPAGDRVELVSSLNALTTPLKADFDVDLNASDGSIYDILLKVDSFHLIPYGDPDVEESPPRHPFAQPEYSLEIAPSRDLQYNEYNRNYVILSRVKLQGGAVSHIQDYIPPCSSMESDARLVDFYHSYYGFLLTLEQSVLQIITKGNANTNKSQLASSVDFLCRRLFSMIELEKDALNMHYRFNSPAVFVTHVKRVSRCIGNSIELLTNLGKDELLNYIERIIKISPGEYLKCLKDIVDEDYNHYDVNEMLLSVQKFCQINGKLFKDWSGLSFIGKDAEEETIFVAEKKVEKNRWDFG
jgi:hypothetical protein